MRCSILYWENLEKPRKLVSVSSYEYRIFVLRNRIAAYMNRTVATHIHTGKIKRADSYEARRTCGTYTFVSNYVLCIRIKPTSTYEVMWMYYNIKYRKLPTRFGHLLCPSSGRNRSEISVHGREICLMYVWYWLKLHRRQSYPGKRNCSVTENMLRHFLVNIYPNGKCFGIFFLFEWGLILIFRQINCFLHC